MAGSRTSGGSKGKGKGKGKVSSTDIPDIYSDMLAEALPAQHEVTDRPLKKRKTALQQAQQAQTNVALSVKKQDIDEAEDDDVEFEEIEIEDSSALQQTAYRSEDEDSQDNDSNWKPLDLDDYYEEEQAEDLELVLVDRPSARQPVNRRKKAVTNVDRIFRLERHKLHILCLLSHVSRRNEWCNDLEVHRSLKLLLDKKMVTFLNPKPDLSQFGRTESLKRGLEMVSAVWRKKFSITAKGLRRALWADDPEDIETVSAVFHSSCCN